jgi:transcriptional regulator with XRE-family HTH domain
MTVPAATATEDRALTLLGSGVPSEQVASALGVSPARISQLLSDSTFAEQVTELRYTNLQKHNTRDEAYDSLEDKLLEKLEGNLGLLFKPSEILKAISTVNGAKRRGQSAPDHVTNTQNIVSIILPTQITQRFTTNVNNQVVKTGAQELTTMQSGNLLKLAEENESPTQELTHGQEIKLPESP